MKILEEENNRERTDFLYDSCLWCSGQVKLKAMHRRLPNISGLHVETTGHMTPETTGHMTASDCENSCYISLAVWEVTWQSGRNTGDGIERRRFEIVQRALAFSQPLPPPSPARSLLPSHSLSKALCFCRPFVTGHRPMHKHLTWLSLSLSSPSSPLSPILSLPVPLSLSPLSSPSLSPSFSLPLLSLR